MKSIIRSLVDSIKTVAGALVSLLVRAGLVEEMQALGKFTAQCFDKDGNLKWEESFPNLVVTAGKNLLLDTVLAGSAYTANVYMGLASSSPTPASGDVMTSHAGWSEVGGTNAPQYSGGRKSPSWSSASGGSKQTNGAVSFTFTAGGTVGGCFIVYGTGAVSTNDNTSGTLLSCGAFSGGNKTVASSDQLNVTYSLSV